MQLRTGRGEAIKCCRPCLTVVYGILKEISLEFATGAKRTLNIKHKWPNITKAGQCVIMLMEELDVGYNISD